ncbi:MAG: hypothetical protein ISS02_00710 [Candidatus Portnoybacteria bacterium]|nr:hypothetical protein [Candidatus Portnoybacteria bacterium]
MKKLIFISPENKKPNIKGFDVELIYIDWKYKTLPDLVDEVYNRIHSKEIVYLGGFSMGAMIALILSDRLNLKKIILYSPSPFLSKTKKISEALKEHISKKNKKIANSAKSYHLKDIIKNIQNTSVDIYVGSEEFELMIEHAKELHKKIKGSSLVIIKGRSHENIYK